LSSDKNPPLRRFAATRQIAFHQLLVAARKTWLIDALREAAARIDPSKLAEEIDRMVPRDGQKLLAKAGLRVEDVFPLPVLLEAQPTLLGYYRLLLGVSQKLFYGTGSGMVPFKSMETKGTLRDEQLQRLPELCAALAEPLIELIDQLKPISARDVSELQLITFGSQLQGSNNNSIGKRATEDVFIAVGSIVKPYVETASERKYVLQNASGRRVEVALAADPDLRIQEEGGGKLRNKVAIEIKGGTDRSNAHNRAGEAEKSHQKARNAGYTDFWTIISLKGVKPKDLEAESPTTTVWFDIEGILGRSGDAWEEFRIHVAQAVGISI
jgi:hypothetical protein